jgi:zinc protease
LQFDSRIAVYTGAFYGGTSLDDTTFDIIVVPAEGVTLEEAEAAMDAALAEFAEKGVDPEQLDRIKMQYRAAEIYARDDVDRIANRYGRALTSGLTVADVQVWPAIVQAVTAEEIQEAARAVLRREASVTGWLTQAQDMSQ